MTDRVDGYLPYALIEFRKLSGEFLQRLREKNHIGAEWYPHLIENDHVFVKRLDKLITDTRMNQVWAAMNKRIMHDEQAIDFVFACNRGINDWVTDPKQSSAERRMLLEDIASCTKKLAGLMGQSVDMRSYPISDVISDEYIEFAFGIKDPEGLKDFRANLEFCLPTFETVLEDIHSKALAHSKSKSQVRKPRSENAYVHYFVKTLSMYFIKTYGQPLHDSVAITACVLLDREDVDSDYVRKLVNG